MLGKGNKFDLANPLAGVAWGDDDAGKMGEVREQARGMINNLARLGTGAGQLSQNAGMVHLLQRLHGEQRVNKETVAARGGDASCRCVRAGNKAQIFQIGHHITDSGC